MFFFGVLLGLLAVGMVFLTLFHADMGKAVDVFLVVTSLLVLILALFSCMYSMIMR